MIINVVIRVSLVAATIAILVYVGRFHRGPVLANPLGHHDIYHDAQKQTVVSCVGDSITAYGCASASNMTYVAQLGRMLGEQFKVTNYGASGMTMLKDGLCGNSAGCDGSYCTYWNTTQYQQAVQSNPDIVTIMLGTNDAKGCNWFGPPNGYPSGMGVEYRSAYLDMISLFQSLPSQPKVFLVIPPPLVDPPTNYPNYSSPFNMSKHAINDIFPVEIRSIAPETGADGVIDVWTALGGTEGYGDASMTCDGCHPKDKAMTIIANEIAKYIDNYGIATSSAIH